MAVNPAALRDVKTPDVCALALSFARKHYGLSASGDFTIVGCSPSSSPGEIHRRLGFGQRPKASEQPLTGKELSSVEMLLLLFCVWSPHPAP